MENQYFDTVRSLLEAPECLRDIMFNLFARVDNQDALIEDLEERLSLKLENNRHEDEMQTLLSVNQAMLQEITALKEQLKTEQECGEKDRQEWSKETLNLVAQIAAWKQSNAELQDELEACREKHNEECYACKLHRTKEQVQR